MAAVEWDWFDSEEKLAESHQAFLSALRARAKNWPAKPEDTLLLEPHHGRPLRACVDVVAPLDRLIVLTVGVHVEDGHLKGDEVHNQSYTLPKVPTNLAFEVTGSPQELAERAADWFETILHRPVVRYEWWHAGRRYAYRYLFSDTGQPLVVSYSDQFAPPGQHDQLMGAGLFHGQGWITTEGLGDPDQVVPVRGGGQLRDLRDKAE